MSKEQKELEASLLILTTLQEKVHDMRSDGSFHEKFQRLKEEGKVKKTDCGKEVVSLSEIIDMDKLREKITGKRNDVL